MAKNKKSQRDVRGIQPGYQPNDRGASLKPTSFVFNTISVRSETPLGLIGLMILAGYAPLIGATPVSQNRLGFFWATAINNQYIHTSSTAVVEHNGLTPRI